MPVIRSLGMEGSLRTGFIEDFQINNTLHHLEQMKRRIPWKQFKSSGRMVCSVGKDYPYSGQVASAVDWSYYPRLFDLLVAANAHLGTNFNSALLNWYPAGVRSGIGAHSDSEKELVENTPVLSISLGATCIFNFHKIVKGGSYPPAVTCSTQLHDGAVLLMDETCNTLFMHSIPYGVNEQERISITFREFK